MVELTPDERDDLRAALDFALELRLEHGCELELLVMHVPEHVWITRDGERAWHSGNVKREELAPGLAVEWAKW